MSSSNKWFVFIGAALTVMMLDVDMTAVNLAITNITKELNLSISSGQWIINGYTMAAACLMAFAGRLGDIAGHKKIYLMGLVVFTLASLGVAMSSGFWSITIARIIQGACLAFTFPLGLVFVRQVFPEKQKAFAISLLISIAGISQALGPAIGGTLIELLSWHWIFLLNIPIAIIAFILIATSLHEEKVSSTFNLDLLSLSLLIIGLFSLMTGLNEVNAYGILSAQFISLLIISIVALTLFIRYEFKSKEPLLDLPLLLNRKFSIILSIRLLILYIFFSWLFGLGLFLQKGLGYNSFDAGMLMMAMTLTIAILAVPTGKLIDRLSYLPLLILGLILMTLSCLLLAVISHYPQQWFLIAVFILSGTSIALLIPSTTTGAMQSVKPKNIGVAMGVFLTCGFLGNSLGVAISGSIIDGNTVTHGFTVAMLVSSCLSFLALLLSLALKKASAIKVI